MLPLVYDLTALEIDEQKMYRNTTAAKYCINKDPFGLSILLCKITGFDAEGRASERILVFFFLLNFLLLFFVFFFSIDVEGGRP